jgi:hypothetical protein
MFEHTLDVIKGPSLMHRLDFHAPPVAGEPINAGSLCSLNAAGSLVAGCPAGADEIRPMPMFAIQGINDFDANSDVGNMSGGVMSAVVATGGFEIETTEFDAAGTYLPNTLLTADAALDGQVAPATASPYGAEVIVGVVSTGAGTNSDNQGVLRFWTVYLPAATNVAPSS